MEETRLAEIEERIKDRAARGTQLPMDVICAELLDEVWRLRGEVKQERARCAAIVAGQMESIYDRCGTALEHILKPDAEYDAQCLREWAENEWAERIACRDTW